MKNKLNLILPFLFILLASCEPEGKNISDLSMLTGGKTFAVPTGTVADQFVLKRFPDAKFAYFNSIYDCALAVVNDKADAAVYDLPVLKNIVAKNAGMMVLDEILVPDQYGFAVEINNTELKNAIDETLKNIKQSGIYQDMMKRWLPEIGLPQSMPVIENLGTEGVLLFGTASVTEPMSFVDGNSGIVGFDIEFANHIAKHLNKKLEVVNMEFGAMLPALISGKVDMIGAGLSITEERAKSVLFSNCYYESGLAALVKSQSESNTKPVAEKKEKNKNYAQIGVLMGSIHESYATKVYPDSKILAYNSVPDMLMALSSSKVEVAFIDHASVREVLTANNELIVVEKILFTVDIAAGFHQKSDELRESFNRFLAELKADGTYDEMVKRWHEDIGSEMPDINEPPNPEGLLKIGVVSDIGLPFVAKSEGRWKGFDIELGRRFSVWSNKTVEWIDMPFGSLMPSLISGKIDIITASLMITDERKMEIDFSNPYYASGVSIIGRKNKNNSASDNQPTVSAVVKNNSVIGVVMGSIYELYATKNYPEAKILLFNSIPDMLIALNTNKIEVAFIGQSSVKEATTSNQNFQVLIKDLYLVDIGAGFNKKSDGFRQEFNQFLAEIKANGIHQDMVLRWLEGSDTEMPLIENQNPKGILKAGISSDNGLPYASRSEGKYKGFDIELVSRFAAWSGRKVEWVDMPFGSLLPSLNGGKIDLITASLAITEERKKEIEFSDPYYSSGVSIIGKKAITEYNNGLKLNTLDDISDKKVGIFTGTVHDAFMEKKFPQARVARFESTADMIMSLKSGKIDVAMFDLITAGLVLKRNPDLGMLTDKVLDMPLGVGFNKQNKDLLNEFNTYLKEIRQDGTYEKMHERWFVNDAEQAEMPEFINSDSDKELTVGVSVEDLPYVAVMNGKHVGFDIEMVQTFAARRKYKLEIVNIEFPALVAALSSGKVDMITDGIAISEERAEQINFSDSYAIFRTAVIAPKKRLAKFKNEVHEEVQRTFLESVSNSFVNNIIREKRYLMILRGLSVTIIISILAAITGTLLGGLICFMRMSKNKAMRIFASYYIALIRGTPVLVLLMIIYYVVFASVNISPVIVAVIAFGINFAAYVSEMFRTSVESIDKGQHEAGIASGFTKVQTFIHIIMPQALQRVLPVYKGEFISLVKMTSIVGYIAVEDLTKASDIIRSRTFDAFFPLIMAAVIYILIAWLLTLILDYIEINVDPKKRRLSFKKEVLQ